MTTGNDIPNGAGTAGEARIAGIVLVATTLLSIVICLPSLHCVKVTFVG